jgi:hypothetical protein
MLDLGLCNDCGILWSDYHSCISLIKISDLIELGVIVRTGPTGLRTWPASYRIGVVHGPRSTPVVTTRSVVKLLI